MGVNSGKKLAAADGHGMRRGMIVQSKAGHDKYRLYLLCRIEEDYVWLADGRYRPVDKPKKKKIRHVWTIEPEPLEDLLCQLEQRGDIGQQNALLSKTLDEYTKCQACRYKQKRSESMSETTEEQIV